MRLSSLKIKGFKSFADDTLIHFGEDVIGIVGPNGAGKSNIVDAIRWVLGEQKSRELRLEKMSNVIFNGTKDRRSGSIAEVSLSFENTKNLLPTDYQSVTITRIQYRSGESEYRLNGVTCRLKDITSLFLDTGIGSNSYAIIALGMVEDILADKDNARRNMFEQAAGISRYKIRKRQTLNKLKGTEADLERVEDLLFEIENNLKALEKQAKRARRYFKIKAQYKEKSIAWAVVKLGTQKEKHQKFISEIQQTEDALSQSNTQVVQLESEIEAEKKAQLDHEKSLSERQQKLNLLTDELRRQESQRDILRQNIKHAESNIQRLKSQLEQFEQQKGDQEQKLNSLQERVGSESAIQKAIQTELQKAADHLEKVSNKHAQQRATIQSFNARKQSVEQQLYELEKLRAIGYSKLESEQRNLSTLEADAKRHKEARMQLEKELAEAKKQTAASQKEYDELQLRSRQQAEQLKELEAELNDKLSALAAISRQLDSEQHNYKLTKSMIENLEGFPESIRFLSKQAKWGKNTPLLSDLLYCPDPKHRIAVETYLEPYLNYYVVQNEKQAIEAIELLGNAQKGKAHFFVLNGLADKEYKQPENKPASATPALDVVQVETPYDILIQYLLHNVAIVEDEVPLVQHSQSDWTVIAQSGRFVQRKNRISGGSVGLFEGMKIGRQKNLQNIESKVKKLEKKHLAAQMEVDKLRKKIADLQSIEYKHKVEPLQRQLSERNRSQATLEAKCENAQIATKNTADQQQAAGLRIEEEKKAIDNYDKELETVRKSLQNLEGQSGNKDDSFQQLSTQLAEASAGYNAKNVEFIRQQNTVHTLQQQAQFLENQIADNKRRANENLQSLDNQNKQRQEYENRLDELEQSLLKQYENKNSSGDELTEAERAYYQVREQIVKREEALRKLNRSSREIQEKLASLKDSFSELKLSISSVSERMKAEFGLDTNDLFKQEVAEGTEPEEVLSDQVEKLKHRLQNYGEINPMAVEAYDEMNERYESITAQRQDILDAKASLEETIKEIETTATEHLMTAFEKVRVYFKEVFRSLFTEDDDCDLVLLEPDNPLESAIEIIAKPKGKRPQSISQLSGGEKTLTATALLFALYLLKPAPFCVFDEVDAPLDDANIDKFNRIVKKFSADSQFIIVTHNKQTMAAVDIIYGVYMQEQGVSGVSAVDFRELESV